MTTGLRITRLALGSVTLGLLFCSGIINAQQEAPPPPGPRAMFRTGGPAGDEIGFLDFKAGIAGKTVTGAPFSATISTQVAHTLADGNKIQRTVSGSIARDSQGRTRREMTMPAMALLAPAGNSPPPAVFINDPVAGTSYILHPDTKVAEQLPAHARRSKGDRVPQERGFGKRFQSEETTSDLGTQTINGITAQGTRVTRTIPAGEIGNERPIVMVTERWYAPELQTYVMTKRSDPLIGDTVFQLTNIQRQEPDPALFQVPSGYSVTQGSARAGLRGHGGPSGRPGPPPEE
jgi:hypothetical protein